MSFEIDLGGLNKAVFALIARTSSLSTRVARFDTALDKLFDKADQRANRLDAELKTVRDRVATIEGKLSKA